MVFPIVISRFLIRVQYWEKLIFAWGMWETVILEPVEIFWAVL